MRALAIVPMKPLTSAKSRLSPALGEEGRHRLVLLLLERVLRALREAPSVGGVWLLGGDSPLRNLAARLGARPVADGGRALNPALEEALRQRPAGAPALVLPGDLPLLTAGEVERFLRASRWGEAVAVAPALRDGGTNGLLVPAGFAFPPQFGEGSFQRHLEAAEALGLFPVIYASRSLGLDIDTEEDLRTWQDYEDIPFRPGERR